LVEVLLGEGAEVRVCFQAREVLDAPAHARVILLNAARDAEILNLARPVVAERKLRLFVWLRPGDRRELGLRARDFLDWMQETVDVPEFPPGYVGEPVDWELASHALAEAGKTDPRIQAARLHLDPMAISLETGGKLPPRFGSDPGRGHVPKLRILFPSYRVTFDTELDFNGQLVVRYQGTPLRYYDQIEIVIEPSSLPIGLEIRDFMSGAHDWEIRAQTICDKQIDVWARGPHGCYWDSAEGKMEVEIIAISGEEALEPRRLFIEITKVDSNNG